MQDAPKAIWSILYISVAFFSSLKHNFIAYCSSSRPDCIFEIHHLRQSGFSRVYSTLCCSCLFEAEIIKISHSSDKMYSDNILNYQEFATSLNACTKKVWKPIEGTTYICIHTNVHTYIQTHTHTHTHTHTESKCFNFSQRYRNNPSKSTSRIPYDYILWSVNHGRVLKITSYLDTDSGSRQPKPDEVKVVLYSRGVWNALFSLAVY